METTPENDENFKAVLEKKGYRLISPIGKGGTATCFLVASMKYRNQHFVCKKITVHEKSLCNHCELEALRQLNSPDIILLYDYEITPQDIYLFLEYCPRGTIGELVTQKGPLTGKNLLGVMKNLLVAINEIHKQRFAHLDIKPANILIDRYGRPKYADFGISRLFPGEFEKSKHFVGTLPFLSPEILQGIPHDPFKADIYALGVTFYFLMYGHLPWNSRRSTNLRNEIIKYGVQVPQECPQSLKILIINMTAIDPKNRPSAQDLLTLPIFKGIERNDGFIKPSKSVILSKEIPLNAAREKSVDSLLGAHIGNSISNPAFPSLNIFQGNSAKTIVQSTSLDFTGAMSCEQPQPPSLLLQRRVSNKKIKIHPSVCGLNLPRPPIKRKSQLLTQKTFNDS